MTKTNKNTLAADAILIKLGDLETARINWEEGSYKKSNDELYSILDRCLVLFQQIKNMTDGKRKAIKAIDGALVTRGMKVQKNTSLVTKIVRYVFGDCGKRAFAYARVILAADANKPENQSLHAYITTEGGIEEIRKKKDGEPTAIEKREMLIASAEERLTVCVPLMTGFKLIKEVRPDNDNGLNMFVVLFRTDDNDEDSIVYSTGNETIIQSLLAESERKLIADVKNATAVAAPAKAAQSRASKVKQAAANQPAAA